MPSHPDLRLSNQLCFALYTATNAITRAYRQPLRLLGLTYPQYLVLLVLWESKGTRSVTEIANALQLDTSSLTPLLKRLQANGFVTRERDPADERVVRVALSVAGRALQKPVLAVRQRVACSTGLTDTAFTAFRAQLHGLAATLAEAENEDALGKPVHA